MRLYKPSYSNVNVLSTVSLSFLVTMVCLCGICKTGEKSKSSKRGKLPRRNTVSSLVSPGSELAQAHPRYKSASSGRCQARVRAGQVTRPPSPDEEEDDDVWRTINGGEKEVNLTEKVQMQQSKELEEDTLKLILSPVAGQNPRKNKEIFKKNNAMINGKERTSLKDDDPGSQNSDTDDDGVSAVSSNQNRTKNNEKVKTKTLQTEVKSASKLPSSPGPGRHRARKMEAALNQMSNESGEERGSKRQKRSKAGKEPMSRKNSHSDIQSNNPIQSRDGSVR